MEDCLAPQGSVMPLLYLVDGMACKEVKAYKNHFALLLAKEWERPYSEVVGYVRGRMSMLIIRSNLMILCGARSKKWFIPELEDVAAYDAVRERNPDW